MTPGLFLTGIKIRGLGKPPSFSRNSTGVCEYFQIPGLNLKVLLRRSVMNSQIFTKILALFSQEMPNCGCANYCGKLQT